MENPSYYSILTAEVRYSKKISDFEKILYSDITCLTNKKGVCTASNGYFAEAFGKSIKTISRSISNIEKEGLISTRLIYKTDSKNVDFRAIYLSPKVSHPIDKNEGRPIDKNEGRPIDKKVKDNTTSNNTTSNNIKNKQKKVLDFSNIFGDTNLNKLFIEYIEFRQSKKLSNSDTVINRLVNKLNDFATRGHIAEDIINNALVAGWKDFYEPKQQNNQRSFKQQDLQTTNNAIDVFLDARDNGFDLRNVQTECIENVEEITYEA